MSMRVAASSLVNPLQVKDGGREKILDLTVFLGAGFE